MHRKTISVAALLGAGFVVSLAPVVQAETAANPFAAADVAAGMLAEHHEGEGKCGAKEGEEHADEEHHDGEEHHEKAE